MNCCKKTCSGENEGSSCACSTINYLKVTALTVFIVAMLVFALRGCEVTLNYNGDPMASAGFEIPDDIGITWTDQVWLMEHEEESKLSPMREALDYFIHKEVHDGMYK